MEYKITENIFDQCAGYTIYQNTLTNKPMVYYESSSDTK